ncbi:MAG TPA: ATP-binding protein [Phycisphaerales bacterium]|nr:ATP-binding protein [Phycisphaerales bacterium]
MEHAIESPDNFAMATVDALTAHIAILDDTGRIVWTNRAWREFARANAYAGDTFDGVNYLDVCDRAAAGPAASPDWAALAPSIRAVIRGERPEFTIDYDCHSPTELRWFQLRVTRFMRGRRAMAVVAHEDITRARIANELMREQALEIENARAAAEAANRAKSDFLATMSHEIRTPLNGVVGALDLLESSPMTDQQRRLLAIGKSSARSLLAIISDILDFSKIEAGKLDLCTAPFDLCATAEGVLEMFAVSGGDRPIELVCFVDPALPERVWGDEDRLRQVLVNLLSNAVKFTRSGSVSLWVEADPRPRAQGRIGVRCAVTDTGIGIPRDRVGKLFKAFSQGDPSMTRRFGGTGLGLAICRRLANLMGGEIGVESEPGAGSTFWIRLDLGVESPPRARPAAQSLKRVLIIVNDSAQRRALARYMTAWGVDHAACADGATGVSRLELARASGAAFSHVIVDVSAPNRDRLSNTAGFNATLVLLAPEQSIGQPALLREGFGAFVTKPLKQAQLRSVLFGDAARAGAAADAAAAVRIERVQKQGARPACVLLAEDNEINQLIVKEMLARAGIGCEIATDGRAAVRAVTERAFDAVLMDCQMPEMDGFEAAEEIRRLEAAGLVKRRGGRIPIIALTANAVKGDRERCLAAGMDDYVPKPVVLGDLLAALEAAVDPPGGSAEAPWKEAA